MTKKYKKRRWVTESLVWWCLNLQEGPLVLGNLLVPEVLADPETNNKWPLVNNQLSLIESDDMLTIMTLDDSMIRTLSPGGPGGPSFPELP